MSVILAAVTRCLRISFDVFENREGFVSAAFSLRERILVISPKECVLY